MDVKMIEFGAGMLFLSFVISNIGHPGSGLVMMIGLAVGIVGLVAYVIQRII